MSIFGLHSGYVGLAVKTFRKYKLNKKENEDKITDSITFTGFLFFNIFFSSAYTHTHIIFSFPSKQPLPYTIRESRTCLLYTSDAADDPRDV